jgi:hydrogenase expression/formation protein HypD
LKATVENRAARSLINEINAHALKAGRILKFMEVCGTHTMAVHAAGLKSVFPENVKLVSGPGCPVCVTEKKFIDHSILVARRYDACLVTFGDLLRVPGSLGSLSQFRSEGGSVKIIYSPMDSLAIAKEHGSKPVVFLGVGFETTIPTIAATVKSAAAQNIQNFYVLPAFKTIHEPLKTLADKQDLDGFLLPGHVSAILGSESFGYLVRDFRKPGVVAGFEPLDILLAMKDLVRITVSGPPEIVNDYRRVVRDKGNETAQTIIYDVFEPADASWRGLGIIPDSGLRFGPRYEAFDAGVKFPVEVPDSQDDPRCKCAAIITGSKTPNQCGLFGRECTPEEPIGPCMVSSEGTCAAYYKYGAA